VTHKAILDELRQPVKDRHDHIPAVIDGYRSLASAALSDSALDARTKELIALAIAVTK
jgi:alkylhydroperoxidase/carboxymuconolactone decarboxylase family protein YurZ